MSVTRTAKVVDDDEEEKRQEFQRRDGAIAQVNLSPEATTRAMLCHSGLDPALRGVPVW